MIPNGRWRCLVIRLERANVLGLRALLALRDVELDPLVLLQAAVTAGLDRGEVDEDVLPSVIDADEPEALVRVEPLDCSLRHALFPLPTERAPHRAEARSNSASA